MLPAEKTGALLTRKPQLASTVWRMDFELDTDIGAFAPGQFARLQVGDFEWRDYSIAARQGRSMSFLISTRTGGHGSQFVLHTEPGTRTVVECPLGAYRLNPNGHRKVFVATGTGLTPFPPMFRWLEERGENLHTELLCGCRTRSEGITRRFEPMPARLVLCTSREKPQPAGSKAASPMPLRKWLLAQALPTSTSAARRPWWPTCGPC